MTPASHPEDHAQYRAAVIARYSSLARAALSGQPVTDCGPEAFAAGCSGAAGYDDISELPDGAVRASLGCGNPVAVAELHPGEIVLDLGSGGGIDVLLSARRVSPGGKAYGLDASPDMIVLAQENAAQAGVTNAEFLHGPIEDIPLPDGHVDVVISNCVINLSADKPRALAAAFRVLRPYGRLGISDIIADGGLDPVQRAEAEQLTGCTTGTLTADEYHGLLLASGFTGIRITAIQAAGPGLRSAIIQARRPAAPAPDRAAGAAATPVSKTYMLLSADGRPSPSATPGQLGGHRKTKIYGRLDCPAALRAVANGGYVTHRVFFADERTAIAAGYRPCAVCLPDAYQAWKATGRRRVARMTVPAPLGPRGGQGPFATAWASRMGVAAIRLRRGRRGRG